MSKTKLSVTFIDDVNNREWTYDDVTKIETGINSVFVHCSDDDENHVFSPLELEFTRINIRKENDERPVTNAEHIRNLSDDGLAEWLCGQLWEDYGNEKTEGLNAIHYHTVRNFLKEEYET